MALEISAWSCQYRSQSASLKKSYGSLFPLPRIPFPAPLWDSLCGQSLTSQCLQGSAAYLIWSSFPTLCNSLLLLSFTRWPQAHISIGPHLWLQGSSASRPLAGFTHRSPQSAPFAFLFFCFLTELVTLSLQQNTSICCAFSSLCLFHSVNVSPWRHVRQHPGYLQHRPLSSQGGGSMLASMPSKHIFWICQVFWRLCPPKNDRSLFLFKMRYSTINGI